MVRRATPVVDSSRTSGRFLQLSGLLELGKHSLITEFTNLKRHAAKHYKEIDNTIMGCLKQFNYRESQTFVSLREK